MITPSAIESYPLESIKERADLLEAIIDGALLAWFVQMRSEGESLPLYFQNVVDKSVMDELARRYRKAGWEFFWYWRLPWGAWGDKLTGHTCFALAKPRKEEEE